MSLCAATSKASADVAMRARVASLTCAESRHCVSCPSGDDSLSVTQWRSIDCGKHALCIRATSCKAMRKVNVRTQHEGSDADETV